MVTILSILITLASVLLIFVVYIQNSKGGGLSSEFGSANQIGGVQKTAEFVEKVTWGLAGIIVVASILMTVSLKKPTVEDAQQPAQQSEEK